MQNSFFEKTTAYNNTRKKICEQIILQYKKDDIITIYVIILNWTKIMPKRAGGKMIELKNVSFEVNDEKDHAKEIIKDVSLKVDSKQFVVITGPNGGGKSTLARLIAGIYKPTSGSIYMNGIDITDMSISDRAKAGIAFAFQQPVRFKGIRVKDLLSIASGGEASLSQACEYLSAVGLCAKDYINRDVDGSLSGGEIKRIEIATLLARKCSIAVLDEPEAGIDLWSFSNLIKIFEKMREERDRSIIVISHQERILDIADEIVVVKDGSIVAKGSRDTIMPELLKGTEGCRFYQ